MEGLNPAILGLCGVPDLTSAALDTGVKPMVLSVVLVGLFSHCAGTLPTSDRSLFHV